MLSAHGRCWSGKNKRVKSLILAAERGILASQCDQKSFRLLFARQMNLEVCAITGPRGQRKELAPNGFLKPLRGVICIQPAIFMYEPLFVY